MWWLLLFACAPDAVTVRGVVYEMPASLAVVGGGTIAIRDAAADPYDAAAIGSDGVFTVTAPAGADFFAEVKATGSVPTTFAGQAGLDDFDAEAGTVFAFTDADAWRAPFAGCPGLDAPGGQVLGEARFTDLRDPGTGGASVAAAALVKVALFGDDAQLRDACVLTDDGTALATDTLEVGETGRFLIAGLPAGIHELRAGFQVAPDAFDFSFYPFWVQEDSVSPWFPVGLDFLE